MYIHQYASVSVSVLCLLHVSNVVVICNTSAWVSASVYCFVSGQLVVLGQFTSYFAIQSNFNANSYPDLRCLVSIVLFTR